MSSAREPLGLRASHLQVPMKMTFRHASASRKQGDSIWVEAARGDVRGYGEGCPRSYVTGETMASCRRWLDAHLDEIRSSCTDLDALRAWAAARSERIDAAPSVFCAIEGALLDLFAREAGVSVEALLGRAPPGGPHVYSAVIGNDEPWKTRFLVDQYLIIGLTDFKVKLDGDLELDRQKLRIIAELATEHGVSRWRVRLDANNFWAERPDDVAGYLRALGGGFFAIEEPVAPRDAAGHARLGAELGIPIILDESLLTLADLDRYAGSPGQFIANIKVSRVGGVLRALDLVRALGDRGWPIIVGAHVGETSVLTRAGMLVAAAAGERLIAQEGAFGSRLVLREPARPSLRWGRKGMLDLRTPYAEVTTEGLQVTPPEAWQRGWGLACRMNPSRPPGVEEVRTQAMSDGYSIHYRLWGPAAGDEVLVILHGGMSHSQWQRPLAEAVRARSAMSVFAPDRRGCGLNAGRGDLGSADRSIDDVVEHVQMLAGSFRRIHLAGWCQGAQYASVVAERLQSGGALATLLLITPGLFWNARFRSVIDMTEHVVQGLIESFGLAPERERAFVPIPLQATDFTLAPDWLDYIDGDPHKTTEITLKSVVVMDEVQERSWQAVLGVRLPTFAILASDDRIVDNRKVQGFIGPHLAASPSSRLVEVAGSHALQFEQAPALAAALLDFIRSVAAA